MPALLSLDTWEGIQGIVETSLFNWVFDESVNEEGGGLGVDIFDGNLKTIESSSLQKLDLVHEVLSEIFHDNTIAGGKEG